MIYKKDLLQKLNISNTEDKNIISNVLDQVSLCDKKDITTFTDFLDIQKVSIVKQLLNSDYCVNYKIFGGFKEAERNIMCFYPRYLTKVKNESFPIQVLKIMPQVNKFQNNKLSHRDYLGAILGLGIKRSKVGDIIINNSSAFVFVIDNIAQYISLYLNKIGKINTVVTNSNFDDIIFPEQEYKIISSTVTSLRLDIIICQAFSLSRSNASKLINTNKVFVNWLMQKNNSVNINENDIITVRGSGRIKVISIGNITKKGRIHVTLHKYM